MKPIITVVGSMNMDLVIKVNEIPQIGETLLGNELLQIPGGKGANQGVAIAKLNNEIIFLGKVGKDVFGDALIESMKESGVNIEHIEKTDESTGIAVINVDKYGNNNIIVIPGANGDVDKGYLQRHLIAFEKADIVVFQLEVPLETVKEGLKIARKLGKTTILNPAPAYELDDEIIQNVDILIPNEHELERISKIKVTDQDSILKAANILLQKGIKQIIVTLGGKGVLYIDINGYKFFEAYKVNVVDTTAAGDSFIGGFVSSYIENGNIEKSIEIGQKTAALAIQKVGAQSSLPTKEEVDNFR
ncbi:ribokinase [Tissierella carlieri]|uniref:ribokinase n=1 Tax=Tissierella carlieri TaxID=689904 RepID=UPI002803E053|nr:ribokinase [uncultured Tissierella sp.]MDU5080359.1 ribokinase [Bacillota bacterium]